MASTNETLRKATADVFESWIDASTAYYTAAGLGEAESRTLSLSILSLLEGAFIFSRAMRSTEPMRVTGAAASAMVREALAA